MEKVEYKNQQISSTSHDKDLLKRVLASSDRFKTGNLLSFSEINLIENKKIEIIPEIESNIINIIIVKCGQISALDNNDNKILLEEHDLLMIQNSVKKVQISSIACGIESSIYRLIWLQDA